MSDILSQNVFSFVGTGNIVYFMTFASIAWFLFEVNKVWEKRQRLSMLIKVANMEKDSKIHHILNRGSMNWDSQVHTASETRKLVATKQLNPIHNIRALAERCHKYGCDKERANAITEELYDEAAQLAKNLNGNVTMCNTPPLFGVPISVKECFAIKGTYSTAGMACRLRKKEIEDSLVIKLLKNAGALPICKGNTVQLMMLAETTNRIWGRSRNPWDLTRTPGGSSGGDAALVAMNCVPLSIASDGAGSIRAPACFCGVVGFKPTSNRISWKGNMRPRKDDKQGSGMFIPCVAGPIAKSVEDCSLFMKAVCVDEQFAADYNVPPVPFNDSVYNETKRMKIGFFETDSWCEPCATSKRALRESINALTKEGHTCVPFKMPTDGWHNYAMLVSITTADGGMRSFLEALEGEKLIPEYNLAYALTRCPSLMLKIATKFLGARHSHMANSCKPGGLSAMELFGRAADLLAMREKWSDAMKEAGIDAVVFPGFPSPAPKHGAISKAGHGISYLCLANLLTWPSGVVPVTTVRQEEQHYRMKDIPKNQRDRMAKAMADTMVDSVGLPLGVSVMAPAFRDETCLRVMREIEKGVGFQTEPAAYMGQIKEV